MPFSLLIMSHEYNSSDHLFWLAQLDLECKQVAIGSVFADLLHCRPVVMLRTP